MTKEITLVVQNAPEKSFRVAIEPEQTSYLKSRPVEVATAVRERGACVFHDREIAIFASTCRDGVVLQFSISMHSPARHAVTKKG